MDNAQFKKYEKDKESSNRKRIHKKTSKKTTLRLRQNE